ncbi:G-type lectin S-receptor-like serine/threonine-protein kinase, partial [Tanacetum coccineum]
MSAANPSITWTSPNNTFSFTFISLNTNPNTYSAAITYNNIPIWRTPPADTSATLTFRQDGNLVLVNGTNNNLVWESRTRGTSASLTDEGNFVIRNGSVDIWSSFDNPTDSLVPGQNFSTSDVLRNGLYSFRLVRSGNMSLYWNDSVVYWTLGLNASVSTNLSSPSLALQSIGILALSDPVLPTSVIMAYSSDYAEGPDIFRFAKLDDDGNLRIYSTGGGSGGGSGNVRWAAVSDQCQVFGYCGNLGICSYNGSNPVCGCPSRNFDLVDPADGRKGCKRKVEIENCPGSATMLELDNARFLTYAPELSSQVFFIGISACRLNCLVSGSCIASTSLSDGTG